MVRPYFLATFFRFSKVLTGSPFSCLRKQSALRRRQHLCLCHIFGKRLQSRKTIFVTAPAPGLEAVKVDNFALEVADIKRFLTFRQLIPFVNFPLRSRLAEQTVRAIFQIFAVCLILFLNRDQLFVGVFCLVTLEGIFNTKATSL